MGITRRKALIAAAASSVLAPTAACSAPGSNGGGSGDSSGEVPDKPSKAVTINVLDVAGNLQLTQGMIDEFVQKNPDIISKVTYSKAPAPELAGKIKAQQNANRVDIALVLTGVDGLAAGIDQGLWMDLLPKFDDRLAGIEEMGRQVYDLLLDVASGRRSANEEMGLGGEEIVPWQLGAVL